MRAHEAGRAHAAVSVRGPAWLRDPRGVEGDVHDLVPHLCSATARKVDDQMSDTVRTALHDAGCSCTLASRASDAPARVVVRRETVSDLLALDVGPAPAVGD